MRSKDPIDVILDENPIITLPPIPLVTQNLINKIIIAIQEASEIRKKKEHHKKAEERFLDNIIITILETPPGLTKGEVLIASDSEDFTGTLSKLRAHLKKQKQYTLKKKKYNNNLIYYLDPIR